jgi:hypothetical protein
MEMAVTETAVMETAVMETAVTVTMRAMKNSENGGNGEGSGR